MAHEQKIKKEFQELHAAGLLGHGYILYGPEPSEQLSCARSLAAFLETGKWQVSDAILLDSLLIDGTAQDLGVDVARTFSDFLYRSPVASPRRTLIVHHASELTTQAQNAILKLAEEPPAHALILITVRDLGSLISPLRSRLAAHYLPASGARAEQTPREARAELLVEKLLLSRSADRAAIIKELVEEDKEDSVEKKDKIVDTFLSCLIAELAKKPERNLPALRQALLRQTAMADYTTNKKLQLEALLQFLP